MLTRKASKNASQSLSHEAAGIHLSGPNANKTALVLVSGDPGQEAIEITKVYEKIGAFGTLFSDERLADLLTRHGPLAAVFVDCPLTLPPCVACQRPLCPGAVQCDDVAVAYMMAISNRVRRRGARKARPVNPQSQRVWDVMKLTEPADDATEPTFSANLAPLVTRARTLQRRLNALDPQILLRETQVSTALEALRRPLGLPDAVKLEYRRFETGLAVRELVIEAMVGQRLLAPLRSDLVAQIAGSVEIFHAFITAVVGALHLAGLTRDKPESFREVDGWVHLPDLADWVGTGIE
ncbi:MAG: hypothetical protein FJ146_12075 [Deltaproteobacteria bacterium]|nr:hypothetical protein [Deltaproteobacteria bacterium]